MPQRSLGPVSTKYRMLSSQARANSGQHGSSPGAAVRRTLEQASVGASSCLLLDTARSPWAPAQAPRVARVATLGLSTPPVAMESQGWRAAAQLDVVEAGPLPCVACVDAGSRFPCIIVSYRDQCNTQRACTPYTLREANNAQTTEPEVVGTSFLACEPPRRRGARWACSAHSPFTWPAPARPAPHWSTPSDRARGGCAIWNHGHETSQRTFCPYLAVSCTQHHNHL